MAGQFRFSLLCAYLSIEVLNLFVVAHSVMCAVYAGDTSDFDFSDSAKLSGLPVSYGLIGNGSRNSEWNQEWSCVPD